MEVLSLCPPGGRGVQLCDCGEQREDGVYLGGGGEWTAGTRQPGELLPPRGGAGPQGKVHRQVRHVTRHTSYVTRHTSHVTRHTSHVTCHHGQSSMCVVGKVVNYWTESLVLIFLQQIPVF